LIRLGPRYRFFAWSHTLVHKEAHEHGFFCGYFRQFGLLNWWSTMFYGVFPNSYNVGHLKIHHRYDSNFGDVITTYDLDRTDPISFLIYVPRFLLYWVNLSSLVFFSSRKHFSLRFCTELIAGIVYYLTWTFFIWKWTSFEFLISFWLYPLAEAGIFLAGISYVWHAFINPQDSTDPYVGSLTILNGRENLWNEDYHVAHHNAPQLHWSEYEDHYKSNINNFRQQASIFRDTEEGEILILFMSMNWDKLADKFVDLSEKMSHNEKKQVLLHRLSHVLDATHYNDNY